MNDAGVNDRLATYLNDHLAGATAGVELLQHLAEQHAGDAIGAFASTLHDEAAEDRATLQHLMDGLAVSQSVLRKAVAWSAEKFAWLKVHADGFGDADFQILQSLEALSLGVEGKRLLWVALAVLAESMPALAVLDYESLRARAEDQRRRIETKRLVAAETSLTKAP